MGDATSSRTGVPVSIEELKPTNNIITIVEALMILLTFFGLYNEMGDSSAFGDDVAQLIVTVTLALNRLVR